MKQQILSIKNILFCLAFFTFFAACQKQNDVLPEENLTDQQLMSKAKSWFENGPAARDEKLLALPVEQLMAEDIKRQISRMGKINKRLEWQKAEVIRDRGETVLVVPVQRNTKKLLTKQNIAKALIFKMKNANSIEMQLVEVLSEKDKALSLNLNKIIANAFINKIKDVTSDISSDDLSLYFYTDTYNSNGSFSIVNRKWSKSKNKLTLQETEKENSSESEGGQTCHWWGTMQYWYYPDGHVESYLIDIWQECTGGSGNGDEEQMPEGGSGGGGDEDKEALFYDYIASNSSQTNFEFFGQVNSPSQPSPTTGNFNWAVTTASVGGWKVMATTDFGFFKYLFSTPTGLQYEYEITNYHTHSVRYIGFNTFITSTLLGTNATDVITNNNSVNAKGSTTVTGSINHTANIAIPNPAGGPPITLQSTDNISGSCIFKPR